VTEMGILPPTSVAVLLREMNPQDNGFKAEEQYWLAETHATRYN